MTLKLISTGRQVDRARVVQNLATLPGDHEHEQNEKIRSKDKLIKALRERLRRRDLTLLKLRQGIPTLRAQSQTRQPHSNPAAQVLTPQPCKSPESRRLAL